MTKKTIELARLKPASGPRPMFISREENKTYDSSSRFQKIGYLMTYSELHSLKLCSPAQLCKSRICPRCAPRIAASTRNEIRGVAADSQSLLSATMSVHSSQNLEIAIQHLESVLHEFTRNLWLSSRCSGWYRAIELTHSAEGWHPHANIIVMGTPEQLTELQETMAPRWLTLADRLGIVASPAAIKVEIASVSKALYDVKGLMIPSRNPASVTPGDILAAASLGDADAADLWSELETYYRTRHPRLTSRAGSFRFSSELPARPARTPRTGRPRLATLHDLEKLKQSGLTLKELADRVGLSESTVVRRLREIRTREERAVAA